LLYQCCFYLGLVTWEVFCLVCGVGHHVLC
jgi:hypothetical protein